MSFGIDSEDPDDDFNLRLSQSQDENNWEDMDQDMDQDDTGSSPSSSYKAGPAPTTAKKRKVSDYFSKESKGNDSESDAELTEDHSTTTESEVPDAEQGQKQESYLISASDMAKITGPAIIWQYYIRLSRIQAKCKICNITRATPTGCTTSLIAHLKKHAGSYREYQRLTGLKKEMEKGQRKNKTSKESIKKCFNSVNLLDPQSKRYKQITHFIALWICRHLHPYSVVEEEYFIALINLLEPRYQIPCRTTFSRSIIPKIYKMLKEVEAAYLEKVKPKLESLTITTDMWTSKDSYISCSVQFIDEEINLIKLNPDCEHFPGKHDGPAVLARVKNMVVNTLNINPEEDSITIYVNADNGPNMACALAEPSLQRILDPKVPAVLKEERMWTYIRCINHKLQLAIEDTRKEMGTKTVIEKVQGLVVRYRNCKNARSDLERYQKEHKLPQHEILYYCETRWDSEYLMMSRFLEQKAAITSELAFAGENNLTVQEWKLVEGYCLVLNLVAEHTANLGSVTQVTFPTILPVLNEIKSSLEGFIKKSAKGSGIIFARTLLSKMKQRFPDDKYLNNEFYQLGMLLDPRFKDLLLCLDDHDKTAHHLLEKKALEKLRSHIRRGLVVKDDVGETSLPAAPEKKKPKWGNLAKKSKSRNSLLATSAGDSATIKKEVKAYLGSPVIDEDDDPLDWWKSNKESFPHLLPLARHYLGIAATETESERMFSVGGNTCTDKRANLSPEHLSQILYIHDNYSTLINLAKKVGIKVAFY